MKISTRIIVDQVNKIYNKLSDERQINSQLLRKMVNAFQNPTICISSKNNPYLQPDVDPILFAAGSTYSTSYHIKTVLDNEITPQRRLSYVIECLIFELEKNRHITRSKAIKIISCRQLKIGFLTHMQIAKAVKKTFESFKDLKSLEDLNNLKEYQKFAEQLQTCLEFQQENCLLFKNFNQFLKNIEDGYKLQTKLRQFWIYSVSQLLSFMMNSAKEETIKGAVQLYNDEGQLKRVEKNFKCLTKVENNNPFVQKYDVISKGNFFFESCNKESGEKRAYFLYSEKISDKLRDECISKFSLTFLKKLTNDYPEKLGQYLANNAGFLFQNSVIQIYFRKTAKGVKFATIIRYGQKQQLRCTVSRKSQYNLSFNQKSQEKGKQQPQQNQSNSQEPIPQKQKQIKQQPQQKMQHQKRQQAHPNCQQQCGWEQQQQWYVPKQDQSNENKKYTFWHDIFREGGCFFSLEKSYFWLDFLLSERKGSALTILLVGTTASGDSEIYNQKFQKFIQFLTPARISKFLSFKSNRFYVNAEISKLKIFHVVLTAQKIQEKFDKGFDSLQENQKQERRNEKNSGRSLKIEEKLNLLEPEVRKKVEVVSLHAQFNEAFTVERATEDCTDILQKIEYVEEISHWKCKKE